MRTVVVALVGVLALVGCGEDGSNGGGAAPARCQDVPANVVARIEDGLTIGGGGSLRFAQAVKSDDFENVYFVSADLQGSGLDGSDDIATWATNSLSSSGLTFAVDAVANEFSEWGDARPSQANMSMADDGASESQECVRAAR